MENLIIPADLKIALIVATDLESAIGKDNQIPWKHKADMQHFRETTTGNMVLMGRKTFESMKCRPLPKRHNIVVSSTLDKALYDNPPLYPTQDTTSSVVVPDLQRALEYADTVRRLMMDAVACDPTLFVIGGQSIYEAFVPYAQLIYWNVIQTRVGGADAHFPPLPMADWVTRERVIYPAAGDQLAWRKQVFERRT